MPNVTPQNNQEIPQREYKICSFCVNLENFIPDRFSSPSLVPLTNIRYGMRCAAVKECSGPDQQSNCIRNIPTGNSETGVGEPQVSLVQNN